MKSSEQIGGVLLGLWLVVTGLFSILRITGNTLEMIAAMMALVAGILFVMSRSHVKGRLGTLFLGIYLIGAGAHPVVVVHFPLYSVIFGVLAVVSGVLLLIGE